MAAHEAKQHGFESHDFFLTSSKCLSIQLKSEFVVLDCIHNVQFDDLFKIRVIR